jgi:hypothetical protein
MKHSMNLAIVGAALALFVDAANAIEAPLPKVGMWETRMQHSADGKPTNPPAVMQHCLDAAAVAHGKEIGDDYIHKNCSKYEIRQEGTTWIVDMVCKTGPTTTTTHSVTAASSTNAYHTELTSTSEPAQPGQTRDTTIIDGKWLGACKPQ